MKLVIIFWPQAVGKMTVWQELEKITGLKLFHNHMTIDLVSPFFGYWSKFPTWTNMVRLFRKTIFEEFAKTENYGMIFTYVWAFNLDSDNEFIKSVCDIFKTQWADIYLVELETNLDERLKRNIHPHRLAHKPSKRNIERSQKDIENSFKKYRMNSHPGEIKKKNYIKINNTNLNPTQTAHKIKEFFDI